MAFWKLVLTEVGGFDPVYTARRGRRRPLLEGARPELEDRLSSRGRRLASPTSRVASVSSPAARLRPKRGARRGPTSAPLHRRRDGPVAGSHLQLADSVRSRANGSIAGVYRRGALPVRLPGGRHILDLVHQVGSPDRSAAAAHRPLAAAGSVAGGSRLARIGRADCVWPRSTWFKPSRHVVTKSRVGFRARVAVHHILQPLVRHWARNRHRSVARRDLTSRSKAACARYVQRCPEGVVVVEEDRPRAELAAAIVESLRRRGIRADAAERVGGL